MSRLTHLVPAALAFWLSACGEAVIARGAMVRDSAGISIVENTDPFWGENNAWHVADTPMVDIGVLEGNPAYELHEPRSAVRLGDGRIVVGNNGSVELRYYDATGIHLLDAGGRGGGPGEFRRLSWVGTLPGDSVVVYDQTQRRLSILDPHGQFVRDASLRRADFPMIKGRFSDGSYVGHVRVRQDRDALPVGLGRDSVMLLRFSRDGALLDTLGVFPNRIMDVQTRPIGERRIRGPAEIAFSPRTVWTLAGDLMFLGTTDAYEIGVYDANGNLTKIIRKQHTPVEVTRADQERLVQRWRDIWYDRLDGAEVKWVLRTLDESPLPEAFPVFDPQELDERGRRVGVPLLVDEAGNLWVPQYRRPGDEIPRWDVFDAGGVFLGSITMPRGFIVSEIGADYVLGWLTQELGVAHVLMYQLIKPEP